MQFTSSYRNQFQAKRQTSVNIACVLNDKINIFSFSRTKGADIQNFRLLIHLLVISYLSTSQDWSREPGG